LLYLLVNIFIFT